jgi:hypothetical protein
MRWLHRVGLGRLLALSTVQAVRRSGALGVLSLPAPSPSGWLRAGQAFQRLWLSATAAGLALQPLGSPAIFFAQLERRGGAGLSSRKVEHLARLKRSFLRVVPSVEGRAVAIVWRMGHAPAPAVRALRRPVTEVLSFSPAS